MNENVELNSLETSLNNIKTMTEKLTHSINNINRLIIENVNSGVGVWDSESAEYFRTRWDNLMEEVPTVIEIFKSQESNLDKVVQNMKSIEEGK